MPPARIIIVDDEPDILQTMELALGKYGLQADAFDDPKRALEEMGLFPTKYVLLLTDIRMAGIDGFELARRAKGINPKMHIMFMTRYVTDEDISAEFSLIKTDDVIQKPFKIKETCELIKARLMAEAS